MKPCHGHAVGFSRDVFFTLMILLFCVEPGSTDDMLNTTVRLKLYLFTILDKNMFIWIYVTIRLGGEPLSPPRRESIYPVQGWGNAYSKSERLSHWMLVIIFLR